MVSFRKLVKVPPSMGRYPLAIDTTFAVHKAGPESAGKWWRNDVLTEYGLMTSQQKDSRVYPFWSCPVAPAEDIQSLSKSKSKLRKSCIVLGAMGSPADLTLGTQVSSITSATKSSLPVAGDQLERMQKQEEYLRALEDERGKIEAFKRELPYCMQLLDEAIEASKQTVMDNHPSSVTSRPSVELDALNVRGSNIESTRTKPVLEEFMPLKRRWERQQKEESGGQGEEDQASEQQLQKKVVVGRPAWMAEAQLWTQQSEQGTQYEKDSSPEDTRRHVDFNRSEQEQSSVTSSRLFFSSKQRPAGAFLPFNRERQINAPFTSHSLRGAPSGAPDISPSSGERTPSPNGPTFGDSEVRSADVTLRLRDHGLDAQALGPGSNAYTGHTSSGGSQSQRKARRCWSPELHRRFVSALQQLGGSQVATPKQIRELMKVDGLTNDEVKSHLQKYRLHTRRPSPSPQSPSPQAPQLVVLGWVRSEYTATAGAASQASTGGVCDPTPPAVPQEYFARHAGGQAQIQPPPLFEKIPAVAISQTSPQVTGASHHTSSETYGNESDEEGKSVSSSRRG